MVAGGRRYEVIGPVGKGGFGTVYRARFLGQGGFSKVVALKVLNRDMADLDEVLARLRDEARVLGLLRHRAIVQADRLVRLGERWAVVMEFVEGVDLKRILADGPVPPGSALEIVGEVAGALHAAWNTPGPDGKPLHLIHRDIKPSNIVLTAYGELKVLDFGIARADFGAREAETKAFGMGSLPYMAPERLDFRDTAAADVYALGVVFFELVTGRAFGRASAVPARHAKHVDSALRFLIDRGLAQRDMLLFLGSLLAYDPDDRPTARQLERMCVNLRKRFDDEALRYFAEATVPRLAESAKVLPPDALTGSSLVEQSEGTFAPVGGEGLRGVDEGPGETLVAPGDTGSGIVGPAPYSGGSGSLGSGSRGSAGRGVSSAGSGFPVATSSPGVSGSGSGFPRQGSATSGSGFPRGIPTEPRSRPPSPLPPPPRLPARVDASAAADAATDPVAVERPVAPARERGGLGWLTAVSVLLLAIIVITVVAVFGARRAGLPEHNQGVQTRQDEESTPAAVQPHVAPPLPGEPAELVTSEEQPGAEPEPAGEQPTAAAEASGEQPAPTEARPPPAAPAEPAAAKGTVAVEGDAEKVVLVGQNGVFSVPGRVPEGSYTVRATFRGREPMGAGRVAVHAGATVTIRCSSGFTRCKSQ